jgi:diguanylate cyclase (GGDEF)-like protein
MGIVDSQPKKFKRSVGRRLTLLIIIMIVALSVAMMIFGYFRFKVATEEYYYRIGETTAGIVSLTINPDDVEKYSETFITDDKYQETKELLQKAKEECGAQTLYVFTVGEDGINYIFDTDTSDLATELGDFDPWYYEDEQSGELSPLYPEETKQQLQAGGEVDTIMGETQYGWTITVDEPLYGSDGECKGYVGIDFDVNKVVAERSAYLRDFSIIILAITALFALIYLRIIRRTIIRPINTIAKAADNFVVKSLDSGESIDDTEILSLQINTKDEVQSLSESLKSMVRKIDEHLTNLNIVTIKSETDVLTSILNRGAFEQQVQAHLGLRPADDEKIDAFLMIDVDFFKTVNDTYGHSSGDVVLRECAHAIKAVLRDSDIIGRLGGDEFAVFLRSIGAFEVAEEKANRIRDEWRRIIPPGGESGITASIGISYAPDNGVTYEEIFNAADEALYRVKEAGRDGIAASLRSSQ